MQSRIELATDADLAFLYVGFVETLPSISVIPHPGATPDSGLSDPSLIACEGQDTMLSLQ